MKKEELYETIENIDAKYISEADNYSAKRISWIRYASIAVCLLLVVCGVTLASRLFIPDNKIEMTLQVKAAEIGKEYMHFGATMPQIINVYDDKVIMYDYIGLWVYDIKNKELVGFCDFRPINMTQTQGDPCVFVESTLKGDYVRFYLNDGSIKYLYDVEKDTYKEVPEYDSNMKFTSCMIRSEDKQLSNYSETYILEDGTYISYTLDINDEEQELKYGDLIIVIEKDGVSHMYRPFSSDSTNTEIDVEKYQSITTEIDSVSTEESTTVSEQVDIEAIESAIMDYYSKTIFKVESMELESSSSNSIVYSICVSKEGVIQEPNRSIYLEIKDGMWKVVNEGY